MTSFSLSQIPVEKRIQLLQTGILSTVLSIGVFIFHLDISLLEIFLTFSTVIGLDYFLSNYGKKEKTFPFSGVNAGFGICFFLRSNDPILYVFAGFLAIIGKHLIRTGGRHFLNPSNMALVIILALFPYYAWSNPLQWGVYTIGDLSTSYKLMFFYMLSVGSIITYFVYKTFHFRYFLDYTLPFMVTHFILFFVIPFGETLTSSTRFFNIAFLIFTFHMISDPKTVPEKSSSRFFYAIFLVLNFYVLQFYINEVYALIFSLFVSTLFLPIIWKLELKKIKGIPVSVLFIAFLNIISLLVILLSLGKYGQPDLVFDNMCVRFICK